MDNKKPVKSTMSSNVFYTFGFLLLYIHFCMNIVSLATKQQFFHSVWGEHGNRSVWGEYSIRLFGRENLSLKLTLEEMLLVGGFVVLTILGVILERFRLILLSRQAEPGWRYRNRMKILYAVIAIILVFWTTVQGYIVQKAFDWVWIAASAVILIYSVFLILFPRIRKAKA